MAGLGQKIKDTICVATSLLATPVAVVLIVFGFALNLKQAVRDPSNQETTSLYYKIKFAAAGFRSNTSVGTAVYIGRRHFLTAGHVCSGEVVSTSTLQTADAHTYQIQDMQIADDYPNVDLCLITTSEEISNIMNEAKLFADEPTMVGEQAYIGGFSGALPYSYRSGMSYQAERLILNPSSEYRSGLNSYVEFIAVPIEPGGSGSGVFDAKGRLRGIVILKHQAKGTGIVPASVVKSFLQKHGLDISANAE